MTDAPCQKINANATKGQIHTGMKLLLQVADALSRRGLSANAGHVMIVAIAPLVTDAMKNSTMMTHTKALLVVTSVVIVMTG